MKDFARALKDFRLISKSEQGNKVVWNFIGLCESNVGNIEEAIEAYKKAIGADPTFKEAWLNLVRQAKSESMCYDVPMTSLFE